MKTCISCKENRPVNEFTGRRNQCKYCIREYKRQWKANNVDKQNRWESRNPKRVRAKQLQRDYGISQSDYDRMLQEQDGVCKICQQEDVRQLSVDHCHDTGQVRGLLCSKCNQALGLLNDCPELMRRAINYLKGGK